MEGRARGHAPLRAPWHARKNLHHAGDRSRGRARCTGPLRSVASGKRCDPLSDGSACIRCDGTCYRSLQQGLGFQRCEVRWRCRGTRPVAAGARCAALRAPCKPAQRTARAGALTAIVVCAAVRCGIRMRAGLGPSFRARTTGADCCYVSSHVIPCHNRRTLRTRAADRRHTGYHNAALRAWPARARFACPPLPPCVWRLPPRATHCARARARLRTAIPLFSAQLGVPTFHHHN